MIQAEQLTKKYGKHIAVNRIDFHIAKGEILGFLGPNGAGKSTTMNMITGYIAPSGGKILIDGEDIMSNPESCRKKIGYLPEIPPLYTELTVREYLDFAGGLKKIRQSELKQDFEKIFDLVKIGDVQGRLIKNLSKGYRQRVGLAQSLIGNPPLLILDEPTVGLDPKQIIEIRHLIKGLREEHTIVLSSHILPEISAVCERILIINKGEIVASDTPENLSRRLTGASRLLLTIKGSESEAEAALKTIKGLNNLSPAPGKEEGTITFILEAEDGMDIRDEVFEILSCQKLPIYQMRPMEMSLEEIFLNLTTKEEEGVL